MQSKARRRAGDRNGACEEQPALSAMDAAAVRCVLDAVAALGDLSAVRDEAGFHEHAAAALRPVLPGTWTACERYTFKPHAPGGANGAEFVQYESGTVVEAVTPALYEAFKPHVHEHAFFHDLQRHCAKSNHRGSTGEATTVVTMDAFAKRGRRFGRMGLYADFYRHLDITDQLSLGFALGQDEAVLLTYSRDAAYGPSEVARLASLGPHLIAAWRTFKQLEALRHQPHAAAEGPRDPAEMIRRFGLPRRRAEVLALLVEGASNRAIAAKLGLSVGTVRKHVELLLLDMGVSDRHEAARMVQANTAGTPWRRKGVRNRF